MFAFGLKCRTAKVIRRGAHALFLGDYIDKELIQESELNDEAKAALYFYAAANCLFDLYLQMKMSLAGDKRWAAIDFFMDNTLNGIEELGEGWGEGEPGYRFVWLALIRPAGTFSRREKGIKKGRCFRSGLFSFRQDYLPNFSL